MNHISGIILFILIATFLSTNCQARELSLSETEMGVPKGVYQFGINMERSGQVAIKAPRTKPVIKWTKKIHDERDSSMSPILTDVNGGIWYILNFLDRNDTIYKLNPMGEIEIKYILPTGVLRAEPVVLLERAVIILELRKYQHNENKVVSLRCFDLDGNQIWHTENECSVFLDFEACRLPGNRVIIADGKHNEGHFNIYSLSNGELISTIALSGNPSSASLPGLVFVDDETWIYSSNSIKEEDLNDVSYLTCSDGKGKLYWQSDKSLIYQTQLIRDPIHGIIFSGSRTSLCAFDEETGKLIWQKEYSGMSLSFPSFVWSFPIGYYSNGDLLVATIGKESELMRLEPISGDIIWHQITKIEYPFLMNYVIFDDEEVMYGKRSGLVLLDKDGSVLWEITNSEFGLSNDDRLSLWSINPVSENKIVVCFRHAEKDDNYIVSLECKK